MARKTTVSLLSDLSGKTAAETVSFALDGVFYEIDLTAREARQLRKALADFVNAGRRTARTRRPSRRSDPARRARLNDIRRWAREHGHHVSSRGRIPLRLVQAYDATH